MNIDAAADQKPLAVLAYADGPAVATETEWRPTPNGGVQLVVPVVPIWRRVIGPAILLAVLMPVFVALLTSAVGVSLESMNPREHLFFGAVVVDLLAIAMTVYWIRLLVRIVRIARHGRRPFSIRIGNGEFSITPVAEDAMPAGTWFSRDVTNVRVDYITRNFGRGDARFLITLCNGHELVTNVPWPTFGTVEIETRLWGELARDAAAHPETQNTAQTAGSIPCES